MAPLDLLDIVFALYEFNQEAFTETEYTVYLLKSAEPFVVSPGTYDFGCITTKFWIEVK